MSGAAGRRSDAVRRRVCVWHGASFSLLLLFLASLFPCPAIARAGPDAATTRIVSLMPNVTELVFAMGAQDQLAGVSDYCIYPPEAAAKPRVGGLMNPNLERTLALRPTHVILHNSQADFARKLERANIRPVTLRADTLADVRETVLALGRVTGLTTAAAALNRRIDGDLAGPWEALAPDGRPRALLVMARDPGSLRGLYAAGPRNHLSQILEIVGGRNVVTGSTHPSRPMTIEEVLTADPDIIVDFSSADGGAAKASAAADADLLRAWKDAPTLRALRNGRIYLLRDPHLAVPGPAMGLVAARLAAFVRGEPAPPPPEAPAAR